MRRTIVSRSARWPATNAPFALALIFFFGCDAPPPSSTQTFATFNAGRAIAAGYPPLTVAQQRALRRIKMSDLQNWDSVRFFIVPAKPHAQTLFAYYPQSLLAVDLVSCRTVIELKAGRAFITQNLSQPSCDR